MSQFKRFASVTQKITLALLGAFLMIFLLLHAGINLCMLRADGGEWFRAAAHFMGTNYIIKVFEVVLFAVFILHIALGVVLQIQNWRARPVRYKVSTKSATAPGSRFMIYTGILVAIFLVLHMLNFYFVKMDIVPGKYLVKIDAVQNADPVYVQQNQERLIEMFRDTETGSFKDVAGNITREELEVVFGPEFSDYEPDFYTMAVDLFNNTAYLVIYLVLILALCIHLIHAFPSALHTLGLNGPRYDKALKCIGALYAVVVTLMFWAVAIGLNILY
ncbi:MAG: succinate dehydrogenase cytochrome b subunit [Bacteroidales bacterium]|nr:succinate dehydrogenase cytochrome b subunit [Bacteroidales bacterium]